MCLEFGHFNTIGEMYKIARDSLKQRMCTLNLIILPLIGEMYALQFKDVYLKFRHMYLPVAPWDRFKFQTWLPVDKIKLPGTV